MGTRHYATGEVLGCHLFAAPGLISTFAWPRPAGSSKGFLGSHPSPEYTPIWTKLPRVPSFWTMAAVLIGRKACLLPRYCQLSSFCMLGGLITVLGRTGLADIWFIFCMLAGRCATHDRAAARPRR